MNCMHLRPLSVCGTCAPVADAFWRKHRRAPALRDLACCAETIDLYVSRVWPIEGPTNLRCHCGNLWTYRHGGWHEKLP